MTPERWQQIEKIYHSALELEESQRATLLEETCAGDEALRREVESLLRLDSRGNRFIEEPALEVATKMIAQQPQSLIGQQIGSYQMVSLLGAGGMGVVYQARDTRLRRPVAIKVLPADKVTDPERKRRFIQEARAASALNHPNIIAIYDIGTESGVDFIVMEYVVGKTLDQLIGRKGMRLSEALKLAVQMADALAKAHSAGIVHRDLKPTNVMVTEDGLVKVLDFGLAKLTELSGSAAAATLTLEHRTEEGTIVGTVSYMSPEQAEGKRVDVRSDIFSFGSVLYEMVTGQKAFQGDTKMSTLAAIMNQEPKPVSQLVPGIPHDLEKIVQRCLRKDRERRWQNMSDLKVALQELKEESDSGKLVAAPATRRTGPWRLIWIVAPLALLAAVAVAVWFNRSNSEAPEEPITSLPLTSYPGYEGHASFSPDGNQVAFEWNGEKQDNDDIYVKLIGPGGSLRLTTDPARDYSPAWSPDGRFIAFVRPARGATRELSREKVAVWLIPALGGPERKLAETSRLFRWGGSHVAWSPDGNSLVISDKVSSNEPASLFLLSIETWEKRRLTSPPEKWMNDFGAAFSPDGRTLAFSRSTSYSNSDLYLLALSDSVAPMGEPRRLTFDNRGNFGPAWTPNGGEIIFASGEEGSTTLWRMPASGSVKPQRVASIGEVGSDPALSRQGHRLAYTHALGDENIWRVEVGPPGKASPPTSFISSTRVDASPEYSPNGKRIAFASGRSSGGYEIEIWLCNSDGSGTQQLTTMGAGSGFPRWSPDGERIAFDSNVDGQFEVYVISANGGRPQRLTSDPSTDAVPSWSGDGKWIYFASEHSGEYQVWKMPSSGGKAVQVTRRGGMMAFESPDGKSVYYTKRDGSSSLWKVPVGGGEETEVVASVARRSFAVVDKGIYFISVPSSSSDCLIQFLSFASGKIKPVAITGKSWPFSFTVSPDEQSFLYSQVDLLGSDLMLVENFR
jgi:Tol biopolymer transport system component/predicted Ser/Thr protein kinase